MGLYKIPTGIALCFEWENMTTYTRLDKYNYFGLVLCISERTYPKSDPKMCISERTYPKSDPKMSLSDLE